MSLQPIIFENTGETKNWKMIETQTNKRQK